MKITIARETLLSAVARVTNIVARNATMPILSHILVRAKNDQLTLTGTDLEVEMVSSCPAKVEDEGELTLPARKLFDILRALPDGTQLKFSTKGDMVTVQAGKSRFVLSALQANDFPAMDPTEGSADTLTIPQSQMSELLDRTAFAAANNDVRYYLNGVLIDARPGMLRCAATDGHRLACHEVPVEGSTLARKALLPRKGVQELMRLIGDSDDQITLDFARGSLRVTSGRTVMTSKLIDGQFPDYEAVIPVQHSNQVKVEVGAFRGALGRASILANEQYRGVRLTFSEGSVAIAASNAQQEDAHEEVDAEVNIDSSSLSIGFNVDYVQQALAAMRGEFAVFKLGDATQSVLILEADTDACRQVVMPVRL